MYVHKMRQVRHPARLMALLVAVTVAALLSAPCHAAASAAAHLSRTFAPVGDPVVPTDGQVFTRSATLAAGEYMLPRGIAIGADNVQLHMTGVVLRGADSGSGASVGVRADGFDGVGIVNATATGYYYGARVTASTGASIVGCNFSSNWRDPLAYNATPPWLNINVAPGDAAFGDDRTNLGGGLYLENVTAITVTDNVMVQQENGIDAFASVDGVFARNNCSDNVGWGLHFWRSTGNTIVDNVADRCTRGPGHYTCDTSGLLLNCGCSNNSVAHNSFRWGGDGIFMSGFPRQGKDECCPSNNNRIRENNCSFSPNNAIESTFATGNVFDGNQLDGSNYGLWLGYSHDGNIVSGNACLGCVTAGLAIEHGQNNTIVGNTFSNGTGDGIQLYSDLAIHFPASQFGCLALPDAAHSARYDISGNQLIGNQGAGIAMHNTTDSLVYNNAIVRGNGTGSTTAFDLQLNTGNRWSTTKTPGRNIVGGRWIAGNYWSDYHGKDTDGDGIGNTELPFNNGGQLVPGDSAPLVLPTPPAV